MSSSHLPMRYGPYKQRKRTRFAPTQIEAQAVPRVVLRMKTVIRESNSHILNVLEILYDIAIDALCTLIDTTNYCYATAILVRSHKYHLLQARAALANMLGSIPLLCRYGRDLYKRNPIRHAVLIAYERTVALHYPLAAGQIFTDRAIDKAMDRRWFACAWPQWPSILSGPTSLGPLTNVHPVGIVDGEQEPSESDMWSMARVTRHQRHVIGALEGRSVPKSYKHANWILRIAGKNDSCDDLNHLPLKVQTFVADSRALFLTAYRVYPSIRPIIFGKCHHRTCNRIFYRGGLDDKYGEGVHSNGALIDILEDMYDKPTSVYWHGCCTGGDTSSYPSQLQRFCCFSCYANWRDDLRTLVGLSRITMLTEPCVTNRCANPMDMIPLTLSQALRRNARLGRSMRECICAPLPPTVHKRDRDDVVLQLKQVLNVDLAMLIAATEVGDRWVHTHTLPGSTNDWRRHCWAHVLKPLSTFYRFNEPDAVISSLLTRPAFFQLAVRRAPALFNQQVSDHTKLTFSLAKASNKSSTQSMGVSYGL